MEEVSVLSGRNSTPPQGLSNEHLHSQERLTVSLHSQSVMAPSQKSKTSQKQKPKNIVKLREDQLGPEAVRQLDLRVDKYMRTIQGLNQPVRSMSQAVLYPLMSASLDEKKAFKL